MTQSTTVTTQTLQDSRAKRQYKARKWADFEIRSLIEDGYNITSEKESQRWPYRVTHLDHENGRHILVVLSGSNVSIIGRGKILKQINY